MTVARAAATPSNVLWLSLSTITRHASSLPLSGRPVRGFLVGVSESGTIELPRVGQPGSGLGDAWRVIVLNDNHNTFDGVAHALSRVIPGVSLDDGYRIADKIHNTGQAIVWSGPKEPAEFYWEQLNDAGLTMAPLEQG